MDILIRCAEQCSVHSLKCNDLKGFFNSLQFCPKKGFNFQLAIFQIRMEEPLKTQSVHHGSSLKNKTTPGTPNKSVNFKISPVCEKEREKFLTAKYGAHQMSLIRKRLKVTFVLISKYV